MIESAKYYSKQEDISRFGIFENYNNNFDNESNKVIFSPDIKTKVNNICQNPVRYSDVNLFNKTKITSFAPKPCKTKLLPKN